MESGRIDFEHWEATDIGKLKDQDWVCLEGQQVQLSYAIVLVSAWWQDVPAAEDLNLEDPFAEGTAAAEAGEQSEGSQWMFMRAHLGVLQLRPMM